MGTALFTHDHHGGHAAQIGRNGRRIGDIVVLHTGFPQGFQNRGSLSSVGSLAVHPLLSARTLSASSPATMKDCLQGYGVFILHQRQGPCGGFPGGLCLSQPSTWRVVDIHIGVSKIQLKLGNHCAAAGIRQTLLVHAVHQMRVDRTPLPRMSRRRWRRQQVTPVRLDDPSISQFAAQGSVITAEDWSATSPPHRRRKRHGGIAIGHHAAAPSMAALNPANAAQWSPPI